MKLSVRKVEEAVASGDKAAAKAALCRRRADSDARLAEGRRPQKIGRAQSFAPGRARQIAWPERRRDHFFLRGRPWPAMWQKSLSIDPGGVGMAATDFSRIQVFRAHVHPRYGPDAGS